MTLYAADVMDIAKPVEKKQRKKKEPLTPPPSETEHPTQSAPKKEKKPMTEAQKAALEKAKEARLKKKQEKEEAAKVAAAAKAAEEAIASKQEQEALAKKEAAKEKRRLARQKRKADQMLANEIDTAVKEVSKRAESTSEVSVPQAPPAKVKKPRKVRNPDEPPTWFSKYIEGVKREQSVGEKKPVKQIQQEAQEVAKAKWDNGMVRDRLQNEVDSHMNRMYSMIFGR